MISRRPGGDLADPALSWPCDVAILGLPYEGGACFRPGSAGAPARLRAISTSSPAISEEGYAVDASLLRVRDLGDLQPAPGDGPDAIRDELFGRIERTVIETFRLAALAGRNTFLISLGGDHSVTIPILRGFSLGFPEGYGLVSLDAHPDLFDTYGGSRLSAASPIRRALEGSRLKPEHVLILGTRSYNQVELDFMKERGIHFVPARRIGEQGIEATVALARARLAGLGNIYLTLDIDVADPSCAPGTGAPVAGGLSSRQLLDLTRGLLEALPVRAMDLVEVAPPLDPSDVTLFLALQILFETFAVLAEKRKPLPR